MKNMETTTLRIPTEVNAIVKENAEKIGISANSYILVALKIGIKMLESDVHFTYPDFGS